MANILVFKCGKLTYSRVVRDKKTLLTDKIQKTHNVIFFSIHVSSFLSSSKVIRQPFLTDRLKIAMKENTLYLIYLNEWDMATAAFTLQCSEARVKHLLFLLYYLNFRKRIFLKKYIIPFCLYQTELV